MLTFLNPKRFKRLDWKVLFQTPSPARRVVREWSIGIYIGATPWEIGPANYIVNPVVNRSDVTERRASFVADPFMLLVDGPWYMFFEVLNSKTDKGEIALATSANGFTWQYQQIVLAEPFHLSYPYVFA